MQDDLSDKYRKKFESILGEIRMMNQLSNGLLELTRVNADVKTMSFAEIRIDEVLWQAQTELLKKNPDYLISIDFEDLPDEESKLIVEGNESLLISALMNLMENGCKFSSNKQVRVLLNVQPQHINIKFIDQGEGMADEDITHIFEPFYRSERTRHIAGHGIGLPLTLKVIQLHGGSIQVQSHPGEGTIMTVVLPNVYE
jgi:signal transduction histidine kinase